MSNFAEAAGSNATGESNEDRLPYALVAGTLLTRKSSFIKTSVFPGNEKPFFDLERPIQISAYHTHLKRNGVKTLEVVDKELKAGETGLIALKIVEGGRAEYPVGTYIGMYWSELHKYYINRGRPSLNL